MKKKLLLIIFLSSIFLYFFYLVFNVPVSDYDIWFHLETGEYIVNNQAVPLTDVFSWTAEGSRWIVHSWGAEVIQWLTYKEWGFLGLKVMNAVMAGLAVGIVMFAAYIKSKSYLILSLTFPLLILTDSAFWPAGRPQNFTFLFFALVLLLLFLKERYKKIVYLLPFIFLIWANIHGGVSLGLFLWGIVIFSNFIQEMLTKSKQNRFKIIRVWFANNVKELICLIIGFAATLLNPNFIDIYLYPQLTVDLARDIGISEWQSIWTGLNFFAVQLQIMALLGFYLIIAFNYGKRFWKNNNFWIVSAFTFLPFYAIRFRIFFSFVLMIVLAIELKKLIDSRLPKLKLDTYAALIFSIILLIKLIIVPKHPLIYKAEEHPVAASSFIEKNGLGGRMFNTYNYGGYLLFRMPKKTVFIDGRFDPYVKTDVLQDHDKIVRTMPGWERLLNEKYNINFALIPYSTAGDPLGLKYPAKLHLELAKNDNYLPIYIDRTFMIFVRVKDDNKEIINQYGVKNLARYIMFGSDGMDKDKLNLAMQELEIVSKYSHDDQFLRNLNDKLHRAL